MIIRVFHKGLQESCPGVPVVHSDGVVDVIETSKTWTRHVGVESSLRVVGMVWMVAIRLSWEPHARQTEHTFFHASMELRACSIELAPESVEGQVGDVRETYGLWPRAAAPMIEDVALIWKQEVFRVVAFAGGTRPFEGVAWG